MKKVFAVLPLVAVLTACGTTDVYQKRVDDERERQEKYADRAIDRAPKWMTELPTSSGAIYQSATAVSSDMSMADTKAKIIAYGKICMTAGGTVSQQGKVFMQDTQSGTNEFSELAVKSMCNTVDITGVEVREIKRINEGPRFRSYVLVSLPTGAANPLQVRKDNIEARRRAETRSQEAFREIDQKEARPAQ